MAIYVDDHELVQAHRAGDTGAFEELVREYRPALIAQGKKSLGCGSAAEDAVQETLVRAYRALPTFSGDYRLGPWLHRILTNVCIDEAKRRKRDYEKIDRVVVTPGAEFVSPSIEEELGYDRDYSQLDAAIDELPTNYQEALKLRFVDDLGYGEVAQVIGVSEQNARARVSRARSSVRTILKIVSVVPMLLIGVLKRGEKAAAAVSNSVIEGSASVGGPGSVAIAQSASMASVIAPSVTEAVNIATTVGPTVVPIIAKAAVSIGLLAAVLAPGSDSAVHLAFEDLTNNSTPIVEIVEISSIAQDSAGLVLDEQAEQAEQAEQSTNAAELTENGNVVVGLVTYMPAVTESYSDTVTSENEVAVSVTGSAESTVVGVIPRLNGALEAENLLFIADNNGRHGLSGYVEMTAGNQSIVGDFAPGSQLTINPEADLDGRQRVDGLLVVNSLDSTVAELRIAGFVSDLDGVMKVSGLFTSNAPNFNMVQRGRFYGRLELGPNAGAISISFDS
jgi:RNA polymerase sigma-70 factor (ECF subfamily)